ncbi:MAG: metallopeptidase TldD-related protein [Pyrodictiaceae archaeon]
MVVSEYRDKVSLYVEVVEASLRPGSIEVNADRREYRGERVYRGGWLIYSSPPPLSLSTRSLPSPPRGYSKGLAEARLFHGRSFIGEYRRVSGEEVAEIASGLASMVTKCDPEIVVTFVHEVRSIHHEEGSAIEDKNYTDIIMAVNCHGYALSERIGLLGTPTKSHINLLSRVIGELEEGSLIYARYAKALSPMERGRWQVILRRSAAAALLHEIGHCLEATRCRLTPGTRIHNTLKIYDDPFYYQSPAQRAFDDEAVASFRRTLVEDGVVVDLLHTRETAAIAGSRPGNAQGLFHRPIPGHSTLVMGAGDWGDREIIEETKRGILVNQVLEATVDPTGLITIYPEDAWLVERGEVRGALRVTRIRLFVKTLATIDAISKTHWLRVSSEKGNLVAEASPSIRLQAYID